MADGSIKIDTKIDNSGLKSQLSSIKSSIDVMAGSAMTAFGKMRDIMQGPIAAGKMLVDVLKSVGSATVGQASKIENMVAAFTPLTGGAENAQKMIKALNKEAATTPFELEGIGKVAKQLLPILGNDVQAVTKTFRMLGDTAGGSIEKLDTITRGYTKALMKGKVDMEALNMIAEAGVPIYQELAKSLGVSVAEMTQMSSAGKITSSDLTKAFEAMTSSGGFGEPVM
jgi:tape measure domain-containing protein